MTIKKILLNFKEEMRVFQNILMKKQKKLKIILDQVLLEWMVKYKKVYLIKYQNI